MPVVTVDRTCVFIADKIPATQREIIKMQLTQIFTFIDNVEVLDFYENDKLLKYIDSDEIPVVKVLDSWSCTNWERTFIHLRNVARHYRNVIVINSPTFRFMKEEPVELIKQYEERVLKDPMYVFNAKGKQIYDRITRLLFMKACSASFEKKNVYQFVLNPREVWNYKWYKRIGPWCWKNTDLGPTYEYALSNMYVQNVSKVQDFYWYACNENKPDVKEFGESANMFLNRRIWTAEWNNPIKGEAGTFSKTETRQKAIPQEEYYYNLRLSKYTLISETDDGSFPILRFMEAVILGTVPILQYNIKYDEIRLTDKRIYDIIKYRDLQVKEFHPNTGNKNVDKHNSICPMCERFKLHWGEDVNVIPELRTSNYYRAMTNETVVQDYYTNLLKGVKYGKRI